MPAQESRAKRGLPLTGPAPVGWQTSIVALEHLFGPEAEWPRQDLVALSDEFDAELTVAAYRSGVFPMALHDAGFPERMAWWSPMQRGILPLAALRLSRSLRQSCKRYEVTFNRDFESVLAACADPSRESGWIDSDIVNVFTQLHRRGLVVSVEAWNPAGGLAGGLYGVSIGGLFAGESMFHRERDASKVALVALVERLRAAGGDGRLLDVQWATPHLSSLGAIEVPRTRYLELLDQALDLPAPDWNADKPLQPVGFQPAGQRAERA